MKLLALIILMLSSEVYSCDSRLTVLKDEDFSVDISLYQANQNKHIILMPPTGGENFIDRSYARKLCLAGFSVHLVRFWTDWDEYKLEHSIHTRFYGRAQRAIEMTLKSVPEDQPVAMLGTSIGGLHTAIAVGLQPRVKAAFVITAGTDVAEIIVRSKQEAMIIAKEKRYALFKYKDDEDYLAQIRPHIPLDALKFKGHEGKRLGMVYATKDTVVPAKNQKLLMELWRPQQILTFDNDHVLAILRTWLFHQGEIVKFFKEALP